jgi:hypothetical protein
MRSIFVAGSILALALTASVGAFAQDEPATFNERFPAEPPLPQTPSQPALPQTPAQPPSIAQPATTTPQPTNAMRQEGLARVRVARAERRRTRVVVVPRSFLDAGTNVQPRQERKFLDYAHPPLYQPNNVVTNLGGRVGWHNSPLPGPFFPNAN